ncbi:Aste57867_6009 [Aphanomyces stellatus]|uniref:Aste57867_6009 protein n=1 Tax=Aphanomyces stellatus TaxID=120398 RepID=A0A485KH14_9STRA|nr:hypothetical protein As57867_005995 [Aphanomyces stellatus]VFT83023.1 Aste57867_6009 [Aphanomyces stellatus]
MAGHGGGILDPEITKAIAQYMSSADMLFTWLQILPPEALGRPLESLLALRHVSKSPSSLFWPTLKLDKSSFSSADKIAHLWHASSLFSVVHVSSVWDLPLLQRSVRPGTAVTFTRPPTRADLSSATLDSWVTNLPIAVASLPYARWMTPPVYLNVLPRLDLLMDALGASSSITSLTLDAASLMAATGPRYGHRPEQDHACGRRQHTAALAQAFLHATATLSSLTLCGDALVRAFATHSIHVPAHLTSLALLDGSFPTPAATTAAMRNLSRAMAQARHLQHIEFNQLYTPSDGGADTFLALAVPLSATKVTLHAMDIGGVDAAPHLARLAACVSLVHLDIWDNWIGDAGAIALAAALPSLHVLCTVTLSRNEIEDAGGRAFLAAIPACPSLETVYLGSNEIGRAGADVAADVVARCLQLKFLELSDNPLTMDGVLAIVRVLAPRRATTPMSVDLSGPDLTVDDAIECESHARALGVDACVNLAWSSMRLARRVPRSRRT